MQTRPGPGDGLPPDMKAALAQVGVTLEKMVEAATKGGAPDNVRTAFEDTLESFRRAAATLTEATDSNRPRSPEQYADKLGVTTVEQGGSAAAVPLNHAGAKRTGHPG